MQNWQRRLSQHRYASGHPTQLMQLLDQEGGCGDLVDNIGAIGAGRTGGSNMDEEEASRESSSSIRGASSRDLHLE